MLHIAELRSDLSALESMDEAMAGLRLAEEGQLVASLVAVELTRQNLSDGSRYLDLGKFQLGSRSIAHRLFAFVDRRSSRKFPRKATSPGAPFLVGRGEEIEQATRAMDLSRCVGILGPPGVGKSALLRRLIAEKRSDFEDGSTLVDLRDVEILGALGPRVASALELTNASNSVLNAIAEWIGTKSFLIALDNLRMGRTASTWVAYLLSRCPNLLIIYSSHQRLELENEWTLNLSGLPYASPDEPHEAIVEAPATELLASMVQRQRPSFSLTRANSRTLAEICARLEGNPQALLWASSALKVSGPAQLLARIAQQPTQILRGSEGRSLLIAISLALRQVPRHARELFVRLSVLQGAFSLACLEATLGDRDLPDSEIAPSLNELLNLSLVTAVEASDGEPSYLLPGIVRDFAREKWDEGSQKTPQRRAIRQRLDDWLLTNLVESVKEVEAGRSEVLEKLDLTYPEYEHLIERMAHDPRKLTVAMDLCLRLAPYWFATERAALASQTSERLLSAPSASDHTDYVRMVNVLAFSRSLMGDLEGALSFARLGLGEALASGDHLNQLRILNTLGQIASERDDSARASRYFRRALRIAEKLDLNSVAVTLRVNLAGNLWQCDRFASGDAIVEPLNGVKLDLADELHLLGNRANRHLRARELDLCERDLKKLAELLLTNENPTLLSNALSIGTRLFLQRGDYEKADQLGQLYLNYRPYPLSPDSVRVLRRRENIQIHTVTHASPPIFLNYQELAEQFIAIW